MDIFEKKYDGSNEVGYLGAFTKSSLLTIHLHVPSVRRASRVFLQIHADGLQRHFYEEIELKRVKMGGDASNDVFEAVLSLPSFDVGLYYYRYEIIYYNKKTEYYGNKSLEGKVFKLDDNSSGYIQLLVCNESNNCPRWLLGGTMYHIFVDRFKSSNKCPVKEDAILNNDWHGGITEYPEYPGAYVENNVFFGGDLYGVIEKLDYIKSLGVNCIYLSPIFEAYSNHKYDTANYMKVDSMFGSDEALDSLIIEAKRRGIHIILDGVFNHTGSDSVYFNKKGKYDTVGAYQSKDSEFYDWYNFRKYPNDYECWWNVEILPRVMSDNESYKKFIMGKGGVVEKWMNKGIAGFRLDVADELSDSFLESFNSKVKSVKPDGIIYGEVWEDASNKIAYNTRKSYFNGKELDSVMNYPLKDAIIDYIVNGNSSTFVNVCTELYSHYTKDAANLLMNVLGTHDTERILTVLAGEKSSSYTNKELSTRKLSDEERAKAVCKLKIAYTLIATMPGIPCIFYGDEAGMEGYRDPFNRKPYPWGREDNSLIEHYKKIGKIRNDEPIYKEGLIKIIECKENVLAFARYDSKDKFILTIVNRSEALCYKLNSSVKLQDLLTNEEVNTIQPLSSYIVKLNGLVDNLNFKIEQI